MQSQEGFAGCSWRCLSFGIILLLPHLCFRQVDPHYIHFALAFHSVSDFFGRSHLWQAEESYGFRASPNSIDCHQRCLQAYGQRRPELQADLGGLVWRHPYGPPIQQNNP